MDTNQINIAIKDLQDTRSRIIPMLASSPDLQYNFEVAFTRLVNGLCVVAGKPITESVISHQEIPATEEPKPLTHVLGIPIKTDEGFRRPVTEAIPNNEEISEFASDVEAALLEVLVADPADFVIRWPENVIRGVAVIAGLDIKPETRVDKALITSIKEKLQDTRSKEEKIRDAEEATERLKRTQSLVPADNQEPGPTAEEKTQEQPASDATQQTEPQKEADIFEEPTKQTPAKPKAAKK